MLYGSLVLLLGLSGLDRDKQAVDHTQEGHAGTRGALAPGHSPKMVLHALITKPSSPL